MDSVKFGLCLVVTTLAGVAQSQLTQQQLIGEIRSARVALFSEQCLKGKAHESVRAAKRPEALPYGTTSWGDRDSDRDIEWAYWRDRLWLKVRSPLNFPGGRTFDDTWFLVSGGKQYNGSAISSEAGNRPGVPPRRQQGGFGRTRGVDRNPFSFGHMIGITPLDEFIAAARHIDIQNGTDVQFGSCLIVGMTSKDGREYRIRLVPAMGNLMVEYRNEDARGRYRFVGRVNAVKRLGRLWLPSEMIESMYDRSGGAWTLYRTLTLKEDSSSLVDPDPKQFEPAWSEGMIVSDYDKNIVYKYTGGKLVEDPMFAKASRLTVMLYGLAFLAGMMGVGWVALGLIRRRARAASAVG